MAFATKYTVTFADVTNASWVISFQEDGFGGSSTALTPGATPLIIRWNGSDKYQAIVGSSADIQLVYDSNYDDLFVEENRTIKVLIYRAGSSIWTGYILPGQYHRNFNQPKHYVTITASDGLGELKDIKYQSSGVPYFYQQTEIAAIVACLNSTGLSMSVYESIGIYEDDHDQTTSDSPLDQTYIWPAYYWDEVNNESMSCYDVLEDILQKYGATIRQEGGFWHVIRPNACNRSLIYRRHFNTSATQTGTSSVAPFQDIDTTRFYMYGDAEMTRQLGVGRCEVTVSNAARSNIFKNGSFDAQTFSGNNPYYWTNSGDCQQYPENNYMKLATNNSSSVPTAYLYCQNELYKPKNIRLVLRYMAVYSGTPTYAKIVLRIKLGQYYLDTDGTWSLSAPTYANEDELYVYDLIAAGVSSMTEWDELVIDLPYINTEAGTYSDLSPQLDIRLHEFYNENPYNATTNHLRIDSFWLEVERDSGFPEQWIYSYDNPANVYGTKYISIPYADRFDLEYGYPVSTALPDDYFFNLQTAVGSGSETYDWTIYGDTTAAQPLAELLARQIVEGARRSVDVIRGTLRTTPGYLPWAAIRDTNFTDEYGWVKRFFPIAVDYNAARSEYSGEWIESPVTYNDSALEWSDHDFGGDAVITGNQLEINDFTITAGAEEARFETYTAVAGETLRLVIVLVDDGDSNVPTMELDGDDLGVTWGTNYVEWVADSAGAKELTLGGALGESFEITCTVDLYYLTGV